MNMKNEIDKIFEYYVDDGVIPGVNYSIIGDNTIQGSVGYKEIVPEKKSTTIDTLYDISSLTKVLVTLPLICKLIDSNKLSFDSKVKNYINDFRYDDVTIYDLLTHSSGLPPSLERIQGETRKEFLDRLHKLRKIYHTSTGVIYSDVGYILLGQIAERVYGKPLDELAKSEVFIPLEMFNTTYNPTDKEICAPTEITNRGLIMGEVHDEKAYLLGGVAGHAGVFTNTNDLTNFVKMILNNGKYEGKKFLSKDMIDILFENLVNERQSNRTRSLCWITGNNSIVIKRGKNIISFNGFTGPSISIDRNNNFGIVLLTNRVHPTRVNIRLNNERANIADDIYRIVLKK